MTSAATSSSPPGAGYDDASKQYASAQIDVTLKPSYIVEATTATDVQAAVMFAARCNYDLTPRSGGHGYLGTSSCNGQQPNSPCIQLDVGGLDDIEVLESLGQKQIRAGPGVILRDLIAACADEGVDVPTGECDTVGLGGHIQTGGKNIHFYVRRDQEDTIDPFSSSFQALGLLARSFGPLTKYVAEFKIVLADGSLPYGDQAPRGKREAKQIQR